MRTFYVLPFVVMLIPVLLLERASPANSQQTAPTFDMDKVTKMLQHSMDCHKTPGMAVAVVRDGQTIYAKGFGHTDLDKKTNVTADTLFGIASISKSFAAALFLKLLHEKTNLTVNSKVRELLKDDFVMPDDLRTQETTFLDMLSHKTAMLSNNKIRYDNHFNRDTLLKRLRLLPSPLQFRVGYIYNNLVYGLVGRLAEILDGTGKRWEELVDQHLFKPLGMPKSTFLTRLDYTRMDYARGFMERDGPDIPEMVTPELSKKWGEVCASGAVMSTPNEMAKWMNFHLYPGNNEKTVMSADLVEELHQPRYVVSPLKYLDIQRPTFPITAYTSEYAMGLRVGYYRGLEFITHTGTTFGYSAYMALVPSKKVGVLTLINNSDRQFVQRAAIQHYLLDNALGFEPYINESTMCSFPYPWITKNLTATYRPRRSNVPLKFPSKEYEGKYSNEAFGKVEVVYNTTLNSPVMTYGWGNWELLVWPESSGNTDKGTAEQRIYAKAIAPVFPADLFPMHFVPHPENDKIVVGLRANAMEKKRPPIFCKENHKAVCMEIVKKTYPESEVEDGQKQKARDCPGSATSVSHGQFGLISVYLPLLTVLCSLLRAKN